MPAKNIEELLKKYLEDTATPDEEKLVDEWYNSLSDGEESGVPAGERALLRNKYWNTIRSAIHEREKRRFMWPRLVAVAASVSLIMAVAFFVLSSVVNEETDEVIASDGNEVIENHSTENKIVMLPDSSTITLFPNSTLEYGGDFNISQRKVLLVGEAFFEISHNAERPFFVFANEVVTKVLGTSFSVMAYPRDSRITVAVKTGRVSVYTHQQEGHDDDEAKAIILTPNQQAVYNRKDYTVSRMLVEKPQVVIAEKEVGKVRFEGAPVAEIFEAIERMYKVEIEFDEEAFATCWITTSVSGIDMFERIDVICEIIGATYRVEDARILISGPGCN